MRQTVRLNEVRAPGTPTDTLSPDQVLAIDGQATTLDAHYNGVLTQLKNALGTPTWRNTPPETLAALAGYRVQTDTALAAQGATLATQGQTLAAQAATIATLSNTANQVAALRVQIQSLQVNLANLSGAMAKQADLDALAAQLNALDTTLSAQVTQLTSQVVTLAAQAAADHSRIGTLESQAATYVTASGLSQAILSAYTVDALLSGVQNRQNLTFYAPTPFVATTLRVHYNGQSLRQGAGGDYVVAASRPGVPFDSIRLLHAEAAPYPQDVLSATYIRATT